MNPRRQSLLLGDPSEERGKLLALLLTQGGADGRVVLPGDAADALEHPPALGRDVKGIAAPVVGGVASFDEAALLQLVDEEHESVDYAARGIRVNVVAPGPILTDRIRALPEVHRASISSAVPLGRIGSIDEVAATVVWLCSDAASFITGAVIPIDGGRLAGAA